MANIKGTGILAIVNLLKARRDHAEPLLAEALRPYLDQRILVASWYPEEDFMGLMATLAHFAPKAAGDPWSWMGRESAGDLLDIYSAMVQRRNPWGTLQRLPRLWRLYHDSGRVEVGLQGDRRALIVAHEFHFANEDFCRWKAGYLAEMLRLAGAEKVVVKTLRTGTVAHPARWLATWQG